MVIVAHPDDAEFEGAGAAALWARAGWDVYYVICTDGSGGGPDEATDVSMAARQKVIDMRMQEQRDACAALGVKDVKFLGYPDGQLQPTLEVRRDIVRLLRQYRPSRVICQSPERTWEPSFIIQRYHPDHLAAGRAAIEAIYPASQNPWDFPELLEQEHLHPHKVSEIYITGAPTINFTLDISPVMDQKIEALRAHRSQLTQDFDRIEEFVRSWSAQIGKKFGAAYAEQFHRVEIQ
jgi:LmbE family N-acetylglucosaminyl deacetylase